MTRFRDLAVFALLGLAFGFCLTCIGFSDAEELYRMLSLQDFRLFFAFGGGVALAAIGLRLVPRKFPMAKLHRSAPIGGALFGIGWAICGACPGVIFAQLGTGFLPALATLAGAIIGIRVHDFVNGRWLRWNNVACGG